MTTLPPLADLGLFEDRLGRPLEQADVARAEALLDDASALARTVTGQSWVDTTTGGIIAPDTIVTVTAGAALRAFRNPEGYISESVGEWTGRRWRADEAGGSVFLSAAEKRMLRRAAQLATLGTVTLESPYNAPWSATTTYLAVDGGNGTDEPIAWDSPGLDSWGTW